VRGKRASTVRGGADGKGHVLYLAGGLLHSEGGTRVRHEARMLKGGKAKQSCRIASPEQHAVGCSQPYGVKPADKGPSTASRPICGRTEGEQRQGECK